MYERANGPYYGVSFPIVVRRIPAGAVFVRSIFGMTTAVNGCQPRAGSWYLLDHRRAFGGWQCLLGALRALRTAIQFVPGTRNGFKSLVRSRIASKLWAEKLSSEFPCLPRWENES
jgi:hypothetical protein